MERKTCKQCGESKPRNEFYKHPYTADKLLPTCKVCHRANVIKWRNAKIEYWRQYDRARASLPHRAEAREIYQKSERGIKVGNAAKKRWEEKNKAKKAATQLLNNAIRDGVISKPNTCSQCKKKHHRIHGHHENYFEPLNVIWVCPKCHCTIHKIKRHGLA